MSVNNDHIFSWARDASQVCNIIAADRATLKIILKTKNESLILESWIKHHLPIIGDGKLIIFDHNSTDSGVFKIYEKYSAQLLVVQYANKNHDNLHGMDGDFLPLYLALKQSAQFITLMDTDEFLYLFDGKLLRHDHICARFLEKQARVSCFAPFWLPNMHLRGESFEFNPAREAIAIYLFGGKAILNTDCIFNACVYIGHSYHLPSGLFNQSPCCFVQLHRYRASAKQRMRANMEKLVSYGALERNDDYAALKTLERESIVPAARSILDEMSELTDPASIREKLDAFNEGWHFSVTETGAPAFARPELEEVFKQYVSVNKHYFDAIGLNLSKVRDFRYSLQQILSATLNYNRDKCRFDRNMLNF